ncbi:hypothetical protein JR316_0007561 [Psilocybe cubensis]|uniref:Uncharacterized protein n=2 Tax=Psilocybe cubensis TaxID=181762 RepID=A0A8H8CG31_PSICU|nr:hypothetical protein JR316_0007561 [Psilocybe cubensis]KAH9480954.1 hypothetical protein JR316_0007561 [Psilocybe cubensis]
MQNAYVVRFPPLDSEDFDIPALSTSISANDAWLNVNFYSEGRYGRTTLNTVEMAPNIRMFPSVASSHAGEEASQDSSASTHHTPRGSGSLSYAGFVHDEYYLSGEENLSINGQTNNEALDMSSPELLPTNNVRPDAHISVLVGHEGSEDTTYPTNTSIEFISTSDPLSQSDPMDSLLSYVLSTGTIDPALLAKPMPSSHSKREHDMPRSQAGVTLSSGTENRGGSCTWVHKPVQSVIDYQDMRANSFRHGSGETEISENYTFQHQEHRPRYSSRESLLSRYRIRNLNLMMLEGGPSGWLGAIIWKYPEFSAMKAPIERTEQREEKHALEHGGLLKKYKTD